MELARNTRNLSRAFNFVRASLAQQNVATAINNAVGVDAPELLSSYQIRTRPFNSASTSHELGAQGDETPSNHEFPEETGLSLTIPDLKSIKMINPDLLEVIQAHDEYQRSIQLSAKEQVAKLLKESNDGKATKTTKTALSRLRVDQLRNQLADIGADNRGNKAVLVQRLLKLVETDDHQSSLTDATKEFTQGVISRKQLVKKQRLDAQAGVKPHSKGISEAELRSSVQKATEEAVEFSRVFKDPHEVARLLAEARGEDICIIDVRNKCSFTDYMVLSTVRSKQLMRDLASAVLQEVKKRCTEVAPGVLPVIEGADDPNADWLLVDSGNVVVHFFLESSRREYDLEGLWGENGNIIRIAPRKTVQTLDTIRV